MYCVGGIPRSDSAGMSVLCPFLTSTTLLRFRGDRREVRGPPCRTRRRISNDKPLYLLEFPNSFSTRRIRAQAGWKLHLRERLQLHDLKRERDVAASISQRQFYMPGIALEHRELVLAASSTPSSRSDHSLTASCSQDEFHNSSYSLRTGASCSSFPSSSITSSFCSGDGECKSSSTSIFETLMSSKAFPRSEDYAKPLRIRRASSVPDAQRDNVVQCAQRLSKVMAIGIIFAALGFGPRVLSRAAFAAPAATTSSALRVTEQSELNTEDSEEEEEDLTDSQLEELKREEEREMFNREQHFRETLQVDQKLKELEAIGRQAEKEPTKRTIFVEKLKEALQATTTDSRQLRGLRLKEVESSIKELKKDQDSVAKRAQRFADEYVAAAEDLQNFDKDTNEENWEQTKVLEDAVNNAQVRFGELWQNMLDLEAEMLQKQMQVEQAIFSDLPHTEDRTEADFNVLYQQWLQRRSSIDSKEYTQATDESRIVKDLETMGDAAREETLLPLAVGVEEPESPVIEVDEETQELLDKIKSEQERAIELRARYEQLVRQRLGKGENESLDHIRTPVEDAILGFPPLELNLDTEADVPRTVPGLEGALGWRAWRDEKKENFKQYLIDNPEIGREYVQEQQEQILIARDRVVAETWYNQNEERWEMAPIAASHSVTKNLAAKARIRHDRRVMYLTLKGDNREYLVNIGDVDAELEEAGGFDTLYIRMTTSGIPTTTEFMWIPLKEWPVWELFQLPFKMLWWLLDDIWNSPLLLSVRPWYFKTLGETFEEIMVRFGFPLVQAIVPLQARVALGFDLPEGAEVAEPTDIMIWQQEAQRKTDGRYGEGTGSPAWWISLPVRTYVVGMPLFIVLSFFARVVLAPVQPRKLAPNEVEWKEKKQVQLEKEISKDSKTDVIDPIRNVFDNMKRVKRPQVGLTDFAGIDTVKEEINEVISFLRNPKLFKEMGARPPRGVLIVGESGTGKTTLALAIAAEAKVPMVELQGAELEGGAWVGQGASNVRELFKTARELAPLIIFMDDFDHFAGVRGATSDTRKQDHESLINQLLVELDGFETQEGVVLIATTSRPYAIDEALRRPGRMDRTIQLPMPNRREREQILRKVAQDTMDLTLVDTVDWAEVAEKIAGLTPAQLKYVPRALETNAVGYKIVDDEELSSVAGWLASFNQVMPMWVKKTKLVKGWNEGLIDWLGLRVTKEDMEAAVETMDVFGQTQPGIELRDPHVIWTKEYKFPHAVWAAGRALTALLLPNFDSVDQVWLDPSSWEGIAFTKLTKRLEGGYQETGTMTRSYFEKSLVLCFGPYVAGRLLLPFGENNNLSHNEIEHAQEIAARMVLEFGWGPDDSPLIYQKDGSPNALAMGDNHEYELEAKIRKLFHSATERCGKMLQRNQQTLSALVEHLLQYDCLTMKDMARIMEETGAMVEEDPFLLVPYTHSEMISGSTNGTTRTSKTLPAGASAN